MKFKVLPGSEVFDTLAAINTRMRVCSEAARSLIDELGGEDNYHVNRENAAGGITGIMFKEKPEDWKLAFPKYSHNAYYPKAIRKNKAILGRLTAIPVVTRKEVNQAVNFKPQFVGLTNHKAVGFHLGENFHLVEVSEEVYYMKVDGMEEITVSEYYSLKSLLFAEDESRIEIF